LGNQLFESIDAIIDSYHEIDVCSIVPYQHDIDLPSRSPCHGVLSRFIVWEHFFSRKALQRRGESSTPRTLGIASN
jgi:hypothetical protein